MSENITCLDEAVNTVQMHSVQFVTCHMFTLPTFPHYGKVIQKPMSIAISTEFLLDPLE